MPPRAQPKIYHVKIRSHKLAIMITVAPSTTIASIKDEALSALASDITHAKGIPKVQTTADFELCRAVKDKGKPNGEYEVLDGDKQVRECGLASYDALYLQFRDPSSGHLLPVTFTQPSIDDDEPPQPEAVYPMSSVSKGKRKAHFDDE